jgi:hypothetical protein
MIYFYRCALCVHYDHCDGIELDFGDFDILTKKESESVKFRLMLNLSATSYVRHRGKKYFTLFSLAHGNIFQRYN